MKVDEYVTHGYKLAEINDGFEAMHVNGCLIVSGPCLMVFSRTAIASVLLLTCREFRRKGGEKNHVVLCTIVLNMNVVACDIIVARQKTIYMVSQSGIHWQSSY